MGQNRQKCTWEFATHKLQAGLRDSVRRASGLVLTAISETRELVEPDEFSFR